VSAQLPSTALAHILVSPGHDATTPGKRGVFLDHGEVVVREYRTNRKVAEALVQRLLTSGTTTRVWDPHAGVEITSGNYEWSDVSEREGPKERVRWADRWLREIGAAPEKVLGLELHTNAATKSSRVKGDGSSIRGAVLYPPTKRTAQWGPIAQSLVAAWKEHGPLPLFRRALIPRDYYWNKYLDAVPMIFELGFHTSWADAQVHLSPDGPQAMGEAVYRGLLPHLRWG